MSQIPRLIQAAGRTLRHLRTAETGSIMVLTVLSLTALLGSAGLALDVGVITVERRSAQAAADAAALAGASDLSGIAQAPTGAQVTAAIQDAVNSATDNGFTNGGNVSVVVNSPPVSSNSHNGDVHSIEVIITVTQAPFLLSVLPGVPSAHPKGHAVAAGFGSYINKPTIALLDQTLPETLDVGITGAASHTITLTVNGPLVVNSNDSHEAEQTHNNYQFVAPTNLVRGRIDQLGNGTIGPSSQTLYNPISDPLAGLAIPDSTNDTNWNVMGTGFKCPPGSTPSQPSNCSNGGNSGKLACDGIGPPPSCIVHHYNEMVNPGVWKDLIVDDNGSIIMNPGTYIITGSLQLIDGPTGPGNITGNGVTLYFACPKASAPYWQNCTPGNGNENGSGPGGFINLTGTSPVMLPDSPYIKQGSYTLTAPSTGYYHGVLIFYDRQNINPNFGTVENHPTGIQLEGDANDTLSGTIYAAGSRGLFYSTNSTWNINSCIILDTLEIDGQADYNITCGQSGNYYGSGGSGSATLTE